MTPWTPPPVTPEQLRAAGFTSVAANFPRSEMSARWIAMFNGISFKAIPAAWCYASNAWMWEYAENQAWLALESA
jgi:hypothetical protein